MVDFRRAFDVVPFIQMLRKLEAHGVVGELLRWFTDWTRDRVQRVVLNGVCSGWAEVVSSVVQGSVLGPVLFTVFINDIDLAIADPMTKTFKYADDSKFGRQIRSPSDAAALQLAIDRIHQWSEKWGMSIHPLKTCVLHFGYSNPEYEYTLKGTKIEPVTSARDLGVIIENNLKPSLHVSSIVKKANGVLSQLRRTLISRDKEVVISLYKVFVRPILESAVSTWCPWERQDINAIEKVQRRATRLVPGIGKMTYEDRLKICNLTTLERRR